MGVYTINSHAADYAELPNKFARSQARTWVNSRGLYLNERSRLEIRWWYVS